MQHAKMENRTSPIVFGSLHLHHVRNITRCMGLKLHDTGLALRSNLQGTLVIGHIDPNEADKMVGWSYHSAV